MSEKISGEDRGPAARLLLILEGRWRSRILYSLLLRDSARFVELKKDLPGITNTMLARGLKDLEYFGLVKRRQYSEIPPRVEYSLTGMGRDLAPVFEAVLRFSLRHEDELAAFDEGLSDVSDDMRL
ncbi:MAG: helix-turn-helix transcriptional regulator [Firmicutes bacterium]|nr:helix-turn-helix transcriptional regulator [Bacillota bacterium]